MKQKPSIMNIRCVAFGLSRSEDKKIRDIGDVLEASIKDYDKEENLRARPYILGTISGIIDVLFLQNVVPCTVFESIMDEIKNAVNG